MSTRRLSPIRAFATVAVTAGLLSVGFASPALAAGTGTGTGTGTGGSAASFTIAPGTLVVSTPADIALTGGTSSFDAQQVNGTFSTITVTDLRGSSLGWSAAVASTDFLIASKTAVPANAAVYTPGTATAGSTGGMLTPTPVTLSSATQTAVHATAETGNNTAYWIPTIAVTVPANAAPGTYSAQIVHSIA